FGHFRHARGKSKVVRRILEERILRDDYFVKMDSRMVFNQADRLGIGDEMDVVSTVGELNAELGCDHSAAAICGITRNADLHLYKGSATLRCFALALCSRAAGARSVLTLSNMSGLKPCFLDNVLQPG